MKHEYWKTYGDIIKAKVSEQIEQGHKRFAIYPFGEIGVLVKYILNDYFQLDEEYIIDNGQANSKTIFRLQEIEYEEDIYILICSVNPASYYQIRKSILDKIPSKNIVDLFENEYGQVEETEIYKTIARLEEFINCE